MTAAMESRAGEGGFSGNAPIRPPEYAFTVADRERTTILFGGLTWKHERLIEALFRGAGFLAQRLPDTDRAAHELGKEYCSSGLCNPVYFTAGNLIRFLQEKERAGLSRQEIVERYVYFTAACGGPCRFGMYENEFRVALNAAGYEGFRVLSFSQDKGVRASTGHSGLVFSVDFGMNVLHMFILGDLLGSAQRRLRPFEIHKGAVSQAMVSTTERVAGLLESGPTFDLRDYVPRLLRPSEESLWYRIPNRLAKMIFHLLGGSMKQGLPPAGADLRAVEVDWLRVKPVVKVIGEFWAQMQENDGNFRMLEFLENEGAEVSAESISTWILYLLEQRIQRQLYRQKMNRYTAPWSQPMRALAVRAKGRLKMLGFALGTRIYLRHYRMLGKMLDLPVASLAPQRELSRLANPFYDIRLRGGEGPLEVAKTLYYTRKRKSCHLVLALKPFGCLPSVQSDAVQAALVERFPEVNFLSVETSADGAIHAYSRVQMALAEARARAEAEFERTLAKTRHSLEEIRAYVARHRELRDPVLQFPRHPGVVSTAANFLLYADQVISADTAEALKSPASSGVHTAPASLESMQPLQETKL